jgi:glycerol-3-phosphate dehydrogenase
VTRDIQRLTLGTFDLLILGGGIVGAGIAWDASLRGLSCALIEQGDFASGTSSKTSKLIHGGIRYLEWLEFGLVREALRERKILMTLAPHWIRPLSFLIPCKGRWPRPWPMVWLGTTLYDVLAGKNVVARHRFFRGEDLLKEEPALSHSGIVRAASYTDAQMEDAPLVMEVLHAAHRHGAILANYVRLTDWRLQQGRIVAARAEDGLTGDRFEIRAKVFVNATGPWVDRIRRLADPNASPLIRPSKGIHIVYPSLGLRYALVGSSQKDDRIFFIIPWRGLTLIGTTDTDEEGDPKEVRALPDEVKELFADAQRMLPHLKLDSHRIIGTFAGVRPLAIEERKDPWAVSRRHTIHWDPNGLVNVAGGKFTTFRRIAAQVVEEVIRRGRVRSHAPCRTAEDPLVDPQRLDCFTRWIREDPHWADPICPHLSLSRADVRYAAQAQMIQSLSDLLWRRLPIGWSVCQGLDALEMIGQIVATELGWSNTRIRHEIERYRDEVCQSPIARGYSV